MSGPGVSHRFPPKPVSWLKRDALLFANSIGVDPDELHFLYVCSSPLNRSIRKGQLAEFQQENHPEFTIFPTYPVVLREFLSCSACYISSWRCSAALINLI